MYVPGEIGLTVKVPSEPDNAFTEVFVVVLVTVTAALGIASPLALVTFPDKLPVLLCAQIPVIRNKVAHIHTNNVLRIKKIN